MDREDATVEIGRDRPSIGKDRIKRRSLARRSVSAAGWAISSLSDTPLGCKEQKVGRVSPEGDLATLPHLVCWRKHSR
jgi:hypothetical protein